ncbi:bis(5'-nucleosyl)-tetraphosphatase (symmetrical) YqeK [Aerococcaceae bacterium DSM 111020]|nr:bis(5'-nucleosyl)-tetraphosphatase (symmetrical) YqeK [Aerococcaceae bacterium DSM 111020]
MSKMNSFKRKDIVRFVKKQLSPSRFNHTLRVEETALDIANHYHYPANAVSVAALLHDVCKEIKKNEMFHLATSYLQRMNIEMEIESGGPAIWHGLAAAELAVTMFGIHQPEILSAIAFHTTGWYEMSPLSQIIFMADYIEPGRQFKKITKARKLTYTDLDEATIFQMKQSIRHLAKNEQRIFIESVKIYNHWVAKL